MFPGIGSKLRRRLFALILRCPYRSSRSPAASLPGKSHNRTSGLVPISLNVRLARRMSQPNRSDCSQAPIVSLEGSGAAIVEWAVNHRSSPSTLLVQLVGQKQPRPVVRRHRKCYPTEPLSASSKCSHIECLHTLRNGKFRNEIAKCRNTANIITSV
jgi:hypothetical protein